MARASEAKRELRKRLRAARRALSDDERAGAHARIAAHLQCLLDELAPRGAVALYAATAEEADPRGLLATVPSGTIAWPRVAGADLELAVCDPDDLVPGFHGLLEPPPHAARLSLSQLRLLVVPGLGFDALGRRLGQGGGFYDRLLARLRADAHPCLIVGIAYQVQIVPRIPSEPHDQPVDLVVTERGPLSPPGHAA